MIYSIPTISSPPILGALARNFLQNQEVSRKGAKLAKGKQEMKREEIVMCDELEEVIRWQSQTKFDSLHSHHLFSPHPLRLGALARNFLQNQEVSRKGAKLAKGKQEMKREEIVMCDEL